MRPSNCKRLIALVLPVPLLFGTMGCGQQPGANETGVSAPTNASAGQSTPAERTNQALRAAAEPFEGVTEQASTASWDSLDTLIGKAEAAVRAVRPNLGGTSAATIDPQLSALRSSRAAQDRVGIAMAAVETYRALVEAQEPRSANPPIAVSLLDYAGFRYDALAQAHRPDWPQMLRLTQFARQQWQQIAPRVKSRATPGVMDAALTAMTTAAERHDADFARSSAAVELALVDLLEEQVAAQPTSSR